MENQNEQRAVKFSDYVYIIYKWKKFLFINLFLIIAITVILVLLIPNKYRATATIMIPPDSQSGLGGLTSLLGGKSSLAAAGSRLFGVSNTSEDIVLGILNSRTAVVEIVNRFNLMDYYEIDDKKIDKAIKAFRNDFTGDPNSFGMIDFNIINKDPVLAANIANYMVELVDSMNIKFNIERAKNNRAFIEQRYLQNISDLRKAEDSLYNFQKKYGIVAVPEQLEVTVKAAAEIEAQLMRKEIEAFFYKEQFGENSIQYNGVMAEVKILKQKVQELKNSTELGAKSNILFPFNQMPNISIQYLRTFREVEIQQSILEIIMPMYEQAKIEEQKSIPTLMIIDKAVPPQIKYSPKRSVIVLGIFLLFSFLMVPFIFLAENALRREKFDNPLQVKTKNFAKRINKIYRIKI
jgi:tyrosine-protein kinase Etk/Wzc